MSSVVNHGDRDYPVVFERLIPRRGQDFVNFSESKKVFGSHGATPK
jgi:hypothetical protein